MQKMPYTLSKSVSPAIKQNDSEVRVFHLLRFRVDLASGQFQGANMPLKLELRFDGPASSPAVLTLNSFKEGQLGTEKTLKSSFQQGQPFDLQLVVTSEGYKVMENGTFLADFDHRLPAKTVRFLEIDGDATLKKVDLARG
uniref:Galectin n=1 Tax=Salvator merianae TaxID=96440 RepID=A0A8D0DPK4_SALMN